LQNSAAVLLDFDGPVATIRLNRPHTMNALDLAGFRAFGDAVSQLAECADLRVVVIRGEGKAFMAGADVAGFAADLDAAPQTVGAMIDALHPALIALGQLPQPVLAAVHGTVAGAGVSLMLACDFAVAADNTRFSLAYSRIGGSLDGGSSWSLPRVVGQRKALELALLAEPFDSAEALRLGLVNGVEPAETFDAAINRWTERLASGPTLSYGRIKSLIRVANENDLPSQLDRERSAFASCADSSDFREGVTAFLEKRAPRFSGR
jgi:2-(1,2-epoxy-1,2-dihydrophenyl)acetyl-CoA isomerase